MNFLYEEFPVPELLMKKPDKVTRAYNSLEGLFIYLGCRRENLATLNSYFTYREYSKNELLVSTDKIADSIFFIAKGATRTYRMDDGAEVTLSLMTEGNLIASPRSFLSAEKSNSTTVAMEDCQVLEIDLFSYHRFLTEVPGASNAISAGLVKSLFFQQKLANTLRSNSAKRFEFLRTQLPQVVNRFPLKHQASFIGLEPETLSRVRSSFASKSLAV
jgi:CRP/FNR family transcriptional regulator, anaerobic regulatory protein